MSTPLKSALAQLNKLHGAVNTMTQPLEALHRGKLVCGQGCAACCVDNLTVFEVEAENIRQNHGELLLSGTPHAPGACAFLDGEGSCRIYAHRPYVCRTQGLPLRWHESTETGDEVVEYRDICELNLAVGPLEELPPEACWTVGAVEETLAQIQGAVDGGELRRIPLRTLFRKSQR